MVYPRSKRNRCSRKRALVRDSREERPVVYSGEQLHFFPPKMTGVYGMTLLPACPSMEVDQTWRRLVSVFQRQIENSYCCSHWIRTCFIHPIPLKKKSFYTLTRSFCTVEREAKTILGPLNCEGGANKPIRQCEICGHCCIYTTECLKTWFLAKSLQYITKKLFVTKNSELLRKCFNQLP